MIRGANKPAEVLGSTSHRFRHRQGLQAEQPICRAESNDRRENQHDTRRGYPAPFASNEERARDQADPCAQSYPTIDRAYVAHHSSSPDPINRRYLPHRQPSHSDNVTSYQTAGRRRSDRTSRRMNARLKDVGRRPGKTHHRRLRHLRKLKCNAEHLAARTIFSLGRGGAMRTTPSLSDSYPPSEIIADVQRQRCFFQLGPTTPGRVFVAQVDASIRMSATVLDSTCHAVARE